MIKNVIRTETMDRTCIYCFSSGGAHLRGCPLFIEEASADNHNLDTGGVKNDDGKLPYDLVPWDAMDKVVDVLLYGKNKYRARNWETGEPFRYGRLIAAAFRHLRSFAMGKNIDAESGKPHLAHAICMLLFLLAQTIRKRGEDDRPQQLDAVDYRPAFPAEEKS